LLKTRHGIALAVFVAASVFLVGCDRRPFDRDAWLGANVDASHARQQMVRDLLQDHPLKGMTRAQGLALLGPAEQTDKWSGYELVYVLGPQGIDFDWLIIKLGPDGKVARYAVVWD